MSIRKVSLLGLISVFLTGLALGSEAIPNWPAPTRWTPPRGSGLRTLTETNPLPFIAVTPCRVADTRGNGFAGAYGPPSLVANATRSFTITGQCGIPVGASAVSFNFAALNVGGAGDLRVFPFGGSVPLVSTLNYNGNTPNIANAAIVPLGTGGAITVQADTVSIDLIIDVNGYYAVTPATGSNGFKVSNSGPYAIEGQTSDSAFASTGVLGFASSTTGTTYGVLGLGVSQTAGAVGVRGLQEGTTGASYGVQGVTFSTASGSAGVYGVDGSGDPGTGLTHAAGVHGASISGHGVHGSSRSAYGVSGEAVDSAGVLLASGHLGVGTGSPLGVLYYNGLAGSGTKSFVEPHPTDPSKIIRYVSLEGPEAGTYFRGRGKFQRGSATIELPDSFRMVTDPESLSIQVTPIGEITGVAVVQIGMDGIVVKGSRDVEFFYTVNGVRRAYNHWDPIQENEKFFVPESPEAKLPRYLSEEERGRLIANGTYNADGTVNMETAERLGWAKAWRGREEQAKAAAAASATARAARLTETK